MTTQNGHPANHLFAYAVEEFENRNGEKAKTWRRMRIVLSNHLFWPSRLASPAV